MGTPRKPLGNSKRFKIFQRDGFRCQYCGASPPAVVLHVDHIVAVTNGGANVDDNLVTSCSNCNHGKGTKSVDQAGIPRNYGAMAEETKARAEQLKLYREHLQALRDEIRRSVDMVGERFWGGALTWSDGTSRQKIERFIELLGLGEVIEAAKISYARLPEERHSGQRYKYLCGVCWNRCTELNIRGNGRA